MGNTVDDVNRDDRAMKRLVLILGKEGITERRSFVVEEKEVKLPEMKRRNCQSRNDDAKFRMGPPFAD